MTKIALITGASRGLGRNTALNIAREGSDVIITYQSREEGARAVVAEIVAMGRRAISLQLDVGDVSALKLFAERLRAALRETWQRDTFDHLVNNAGHGDMASIAETTEEQFDRLVDVHFKGVFFLTQALLPLIADGGRIVNLSSGLTRISFPGFAAYSAVKGAVEVLSVHMAKELGSRGIAVNTVAPGAIETDFLGGAVRDTPDLNTTFAGMTALGRVGVPDDIGPMIAKLLDRRQSLDQRPADRSLGRPGHLTLDRIAPFHAHWRRCRVYPPRPADPRDRGTIPSALMREASVVGLMSSISAAPPGPNTLPAQASSAARMLARSWARISDVGHDRGAAVCFRARGRRRGLRARHVRQVDAQPAVLREDRGALDHVLQFADIAGPVVARQPSRIAFRQAQLGFQRLAFAVRKCCASSGMSSRRSRSGTDSTGNTLRRK